MSELVATTRALYKCTPPRKPRAAPAAAPPQNPRSPLSAPVERTRERGENGGRRTRFPTSADGRWSGKGRGDSPSCKEGVCAVHRSHKPGKTDELLAGILHPPRIRPVAWPRHLAAYHTLIMPPNSSPSCPLRISLLRLEIRAGAPVRVNADVSRHGGGQVVLPRLRCG
jgi:hypothetical protein